MIRLNVEWDAIARRAGSNVSRRRMRCADVLPNVRSLRTRSPTNPAIKKKTPAMNSGRALDDVHGKQRAPEERVYACAHPWQRRELVLYPVAHVALRAYLRGEVSLVVRA